MTGVEHGTIQPGPVFLRKVAACLGVPVAELLHVRSLKPNPLGQYLHDRRIELGLTLCDVGKALGLTRERIRQFESTTRYHRKEAHLRKLAEVLECDFVVLHKLNEQNRKPRQPAYTPKDPAGKYPPKIPAGSSLGAFIRAERRTRGWTVDRLSRESGLSQGTIVNLETKAHIHLPRAKTLRQIAKAFGIREEVLRSYWFK